MPAETMDDSFETLKPVWRWFLMVAELKRPPMARLKRAMALWAGKPRSLADELGAPQDPQLSLFSEYVLRDIGMYLSRVFVTNYPQLR